MSDQLPPNLTSHLWELHEDIRREHAKALQEHGLTDTADIVVVVAISKAAFDAVVKLAPTDRVPAVSANPADPYLRGWPRRALARVLRDKGTAASLAAPPRPGADFLLLAAGNGRAWVLEGSLLPRGQKAPPTPPTPP